MRLNEGHNKGLVLSSCFMVEYERGNILLASAIASIIHSFRSYGWMYSFTRALSPHNKPSCLPIQLLRTSANSSLDQLPLFPHNSTLSLTSYKQMNVNRPQKIIETPIVHRYCIGDITDTY